MSEPVYTVKKYEPSQAGCWDLFLEDAPMATFLHTRRFLSYHGDRFQDESAMLYDRKGRLVGVFPAAMDPRNQSRLVSHPGLTYGGLLHQGALFGENNVRALTDLSQAYAQRGVQSILYKAVPAFYHQSPCSDDLYSLFRLKARRVRCDLSVTIDLANRGHVSGRRRRNRQKAVKAGLRIEQGADRLNALWQVLEQNLEEKHQARPVHSVPEMVRLMEWFPDNIRVITAVLGDEVLAGVILFVTKTVCHAQYIASSLNGQQSGALDAVFESVITDSQQKGLRYFDFGICNEDQGWRLNEGLYQFKTEFGGSGSVHEFYEWELMPCP